MNKVLLVDDDVELAVMLQEYIGSEGFPVEVRHDGEAGVAAALSGQYAIVVLDVMMPRLNGIEALRRIRAHSQVPVLMLTARGDDVDRIVGLELGADDYVPKPCTPASWWPGCGRSCAGAASPPAPRARPARLPSARW